MKQIFIHKYSLFINKSKRFKSEKHVFEKYWKLMKSSQPDQIFRVFCRRTSLSEWGFFTALFPYWWNIVNLSLSPWKMFWQVTLLGSASSDLHSYHTTFTQSWIILILFILLRRKINKHSVLTSRWVRWDWQAAYLIGKEEIPECICVLLSIKGEGQVFWSHSYQIENTAIIGLSKIQY